MRIILILFVVVMMPIAFMAICFEIAKEAIEHFVINKLEEKSD